MRPTAGSLLESSTTPAQKSASEAHPGRHGTTSTLPVARCSREISHPFHLNDTKLNSGSSVPVLHGTFDLEAFSNISQLFLRLGKDNPILNL